MLKYRGLHIIILTLVLCLLGARLFDFGFKRYYRFTFDKLNHILLDKNREDVLLVGNSFLFYGINPAVIDSATGLKTFNAGLGGAELPELYFLLQAWFKHHPPPRYLLLQLHYSSLDHSNLENLIYYSYYNWGNELHGLMKLNHIDTPLLREFIPFNRYTYLNDYNRTKAIQGILGNDQGGPSSSYFNGYLRRNADSTNLRFLLAAVPSSTNSKTVDSALERSRAILASIAETCKRNGTELIIIHPPQPLVRETRAFYSRAITEEIGKSLPANSYRFWDYASDSAFCQSKYFIDETHLNVQGSQLFSERVTKDLKGIIRQK